MYQSLDYQICEIISLLQNNWGGVKNIKESLDVVIPNLDETISNLDKTISNLDGELSKTLNIEIQVSPETYDSKQITTIDIVGNTDKICDTIRLKIDKEIINTYSNISSFIKRYDLDAEDVDTHLITIEAVRGDNIFIKNKLITKNN